MKTFSDGEIYVRLLENVAKQDVWVLAQTAPPAENLIELYFLLDALQRENANVNLFLTYFGYARQDRTAYGEALSSEVLFRFLQTFNIKSTKILHIHNPKLRVFYDFQDVILLDFFIPYAQEADILVAPDHGAQALVASIAECAKKEYVVMSKTRSSHEHIEKITINGTVKNKRVLLIDDMIATGGTIVHAAKILKEHGAVEIAVAATHGVFSDDAYNRIAKSAIDRVFVTNSLPQQEHEKVTVVNCAPMIEHFFR
ncbi:MAG: ribose-phosphate diphosphokinase [Candidatus Babeliales bacterium]